MEGLTIDDILHVQCDLSRSQDKYVIRDSFSKANKLLFKKKEEFKELRDEVEALEREWGGICIKSQFINSTEIEMELTKITCFFATRMDDFLKRVKIAVKYVDQLNEVFTMEDFKKGKIFEGNTVVGNDYILDSPSFIYGTEMYGQTVRVVPIFTEDGKGRSFCTDVILGVDKKIAVWKRRESTLFPKLVKKD